LWNHKGNEDKFKQQRRNVATKEGVEKEMDAVQKNGQIEIILPQDKTKKNQQMQLATASANNWKTR
jgi:hypothetical protein